jgi:pentatricopeptide repeat protein
MSGLSALAEDAIAELQKLNVPLQEYHLSPLILALTNRAEIPAALDVFDLMDQHSIHPTRFTARALFKLLASNPDHLQTALNHLRERVENGKVNLASAFNCILVATLKDQTNYTLALGKDMDNLKVTPTIDTYNILIHSACLRRNVQAVHGYYDEILNRGLLPNKETYERIIVLLTSEPAYDDAFLYLHKMNAERIAPSFEVLMGLAKKCALRFDARWKSLVKMMEKNDYVVSDRLMDFLVSNGRGTSAGGSQEMVESYESFSGDEEVVEELDDDSDGKSSPH